MKMQVTMLTSQVSIAPSGRPVPQYWSRGIQRLDRHIPTACSSI